MEGYDTTQERMTWMERPEPWLGIWNTDGMVYTLIKHGKLEFLGALEFIWAASVHQEWRLLGRDLSRIGQSFLFVSPAGYLLCLALDNHLCWLSFLFFV